MKTISLSLFLLFAVQWLNAQIIFDETIGTITSDQARSFRLTPTGYLIGGARLLSVDKDFNEVANVLLDHNRAVSVPSDSGYVLVRNRYTRGRTAVVAYVVRYDKEGKELWSKEIRNGYWRNFAEDVLPLDKGGFIYVGRHQSVTGSGAVMRKLDDSGKQLWEYKFEPKGPSFCQKVYQRDTNIYVVGKADAGVTGLDAKRDVFFTKHRITDGARQWAYLYHTDSTDVATDLMVKDGKTSVLLGYSNGDDNAIGNRGMLISITDGKEDWIKHYLGKYSEELRSIEPTEDGGYLILGNRHINSDSIRTFVMKTDDKGEMEWEYLFANAGKQHVGVEMERSGKSTYVVGGHFLNSSEKNDYFITAFDTEKLLNPTSTQFIGNGDSDLLSLYPNPTTNVLHLQVNEDLKRTGQIEIFDVQGRSMDVMELTSHQFSYDCSNMEAGIYWVQLQLGNRIERQAFILK